MQCKVGVVLVSVGACKVCVVLVGSVGAVQSGCGPSVWVQCKVGMVLVSWVQCKVGVVLVLVGAVQSGCGPSVSGYSAKWVWS